jgi:hypothetical protein
VLSAALLRCLGGGGGGVLGDLPSVLDSVTADVAGPALDRSMLDS